MRDLKKNLQKIIWSRTATGKLRLMVLAANRVLNGVEPTSTQLAEQLNRISSSPDFIEPMLREWLVAKSSVSINVPAMLAHAYGANKSLPVVSLGTHCFTSSFLARWQLKRWSGPFDWLFSSMPMVSHCLSDNFQTLLDSSFYAPVPVELRPHGAMVNRVQHEYYRQTYQVEFVFNHHDVHLPGDYAYLTRCVSRMRQLLDTSDPKVFLVVTPHAPHSIVKSQILAAALHERTREARLLVFLVKPAKPGKLALESLHREKGLDIREFVPNSSLGPTSFDDLLDEHTMARAVLRACEAGVGDTKDASFSTVPFLDIRP